MIKNWQAYTVVIVVLAIIIGGGLWVQSYLQRTADRLVAQVEPMLKTAYDEDWQQLSAQIKAFQDQWGPVRKNWAIVVVHFEIDQIERVLARISQLVGAQEKPEILAELGELKILLSHVPQREQLTLRNLF